MRLCLRGLCCRGTRQVGRRERLSQRVGHGGCAGCAGIVVDNEEGWIDGRCLTGLASVENPITNIDRR